MAASKKPPVVTGITSQPRPTGAALARQLTAEAVATRQAQRKREKQAARERAAQTAQQIARARSEPPPDHEREIFERDQAARIEPSSAGQKGKNPPPPMRDIFGSGRSGPFVPAPAQSEPQVSTVKVEQIPLDPYILRRKT